MATDAGQFQPRRMEIQDADKVLKTNFVETDAEHARPHQQRPPSLRDSGNQYDSGKVLHDFRSELEARDQLMIASLNNTVEKALKTAAVYFLECQDAYQQGREIPSPRITQESSSEKEQLHLGACPNNPLGPSPETMKDPDHEAKNSLKSRNAATAATLPEKVAAAENERCNDHKGFDLDSIKMFSGIYDAEKDHSWYLLAFDRKLNERVPIRWLFERLGLQTLLPAHPPHGQLAKLVEALWFENLCCLAVLTSTIYSAIQIQSVLKDTFELRAVPETWKHIDAAIAVFFTFEVSLRIAALRGWFFVARHTWRWNLLDVFIVAADLILVLMDQINFGAWVRTLRIFRAVRLVRLLHFIREFRELRKFLTAITSCMTSLFWAGLFLVLVMFVFSLFIMVAIDSQFDADKLDPISVDELKNMFYGFGPCFRTLFEVIVGTGWVPPHDILCTLGLENSPLMPAFIFFTNIGVINILVGVFSVAAEDGADFHSIAQAEIADTEDFVGDMLLLYRDFVGARSDWRDIRIDKEAFLAYFHDEEVQAYMAHHHLDVRHATLCYQFCKSASSEDVGVNDFVLGLLRLKGMTRNLDSQILMHAILDLGDLVTSLHKDGQRASNNALQSSMCTI